MGRTKETNLIRKAKTKPTSKKLAIFAMCFNCIGGTEEEMPDGGWRKEITNCTANDCPLWTHRPFQKDEEDADS